LTSRIIGVIAQPRSEWLRIRDQSPGPVVVLLHHALPLSLVPALAAVLGAAGGIVATPVAGQQASPLHLGLFALISTQVALLLLAAVFRWLAGMFAPAPAWRDALRLSAYGSTPVLLASGFMAVPSMAMVPLIGALHALYLYYGGAHVLFGIPEDDCAEFVALAALATGSLLFLVGAAAGRFALL
jgi:hypothetical protein